MGTFLGFFSTFGDRGAGEGCFFMIFFHFWGGGGQGEGRRPFVVEKSGKKTIKKLENKSYKKLQNVLAEAGGFLSLIRFSFIIKNSIKLF